MTKVVAVRPEGPDRVLCDIADYVAGNETFAPEAYAAAQLCLMDSLGCALLSLSYPECARLLGPVVAGAMLSGGARVPGTSLELEPVQAAFNIGSMIRWLDYNDTWLAAEWGHPSDNIGGILASADYLSRGGAVSGKQPLTVRDVQAAMIKAYEIQGVLALENALNRQGLDHVILVRVATAAVVSRLLGGSRDEIISAVSNAWVDGGCLRAYRHAPSVGPRKSWAAGDATSRGVWLALLALKGEPGYASALTTPTWGYYDALNRGKPFAVSRRYGSYVIENVLFKVSYPAEFHAQTAVEAAVRLHPHVQHRLEDIERIRIETQESALRIIDKKGPLQNPADRDHCLQYVVAIALIHGRLTSDHYEDEAAADLRIDRLRERMDIVENPRYSQDYLDPEKRSVANAVQVIFKDSSRTQRVEVEYPLGHRRRRAEAIPLLWQKFETNIRSRLQAPAVQPILQLFQQPAELEETPVHDFMEMFVARDK